MARTEENEANANATTGQSLEKQYNGQSNAELGSLLPEFQTEAAHPAGFNPDDLAKMNTSTQQSLGGATAGAVGEGDLEAARTRNAGAFAPALDASAATAERTQSQDALGIDKSNALLKNQQQQDGLNGMLGLYDAATGAGINSLNASNGAINAGVGASNSTNNEWLGPLDSVLGNVTASGKGVGLG